MKEKIIKIVKLVVIIYFLIGQLINWITIYNLILKGEIVFGIRIIGLFIGSVLQVMLIYYLLFKCKWIRGLLKKQPQQIWDSTKKKEVTKCHAQQ